MTAIAESPEPGSSLHALGLDDPGRFFTLKRVPIFKVHELVEKEVFHPGSSASDPPAPARRSLTADEADLVVMARNANEAVAAGRPPALQIGHSQFRDVPESHHPRPIGLTSRYELGELEGEPCLFCDFHYRPQFLDDAVTYPRVSIERMGMDDPDRQTVHAVALIRRPPQQELPVVPYAADVGVLSGQLACYGRDLPAPEPGPEPETPPGAPEADPIPIPRGRKTMLEPEDVTQIEACFSKALAPMFQTLTDSIVAAVKGAAPAAPAEPVLEPLPDETAAYAMGAAGPNTGYVPGLVPKDKAEAAHYAKACQEVASYAKEVPALREEAATLKGEILKIRTALDGLSAGFQKVAGTVESLNEESLMTAAASERANYDRIIDRAVEEGTVIDEASRGDLIELIYGVEDTAKRESKLRGQIALYQKTSTGQPFIPGPSRGRSASGDDRKKFQDFCGKHHIKDMAEGRRRFDEARAQNLV